MVEEVSMSERRRKEAALVVTEGQPTQELQELPTVEPLSGSVLKNAARYVEFVGMPRQATPTIALAITRMSKLKEVVEAQCKLPWTERGLLIQTRPGYIVRESEVEECTRFAKGTLIPLNHIAWIVQGGRGAPYVKSTGLIIRAQADPRGFKSVQPVKYEIIREAKEILVICHAKAEFWDGSTFENLGACSLSESPGRRADAIPSIAFTRATSRTLRYALDQTLPVAEEVEETQEQTQAEPQNLVELLAFAQRNGKQVQDVLTTLGVQKADEITKVYTISEAWAIVQKS